MVERDLVLAKTAVIDRCLARIADVHGAHGQVLYPIDVEDITVLSLTRATQAAIDLATHVVATEGYGMPDNVGAAFALLADQAVMLIDAALAERLRKMVGFRNIAVHNYQRLDPAIIDSIVKAHLDDLRAFAMAVATRFGIA